MTALVFVMLARLIDMLSTFARDPDLKLEANPVFRRLGWRNNALLNLVLVGMAPVLPAKFVICICVGSFLAAAWNVIGIIHDRNLSP